jgi:PAS domain S-box-containing protein
MAMERYSVLLVEDSKMDQLAFMQIVKSENLPYDYRIASSVAEAKRVMVEKSFDAIVSDFNLGDGNAFDIINAAHDLPVVITTGSGDEETAVKAMKLGACDYLIKDDKYNYLKMLPVTVEHAINYKGAARLTRILTQTIMGVSDSVCITDMSDQIIFANEAFCKMYGCQSTDQIIGSKSASFRQDVTVETESSICTDSKRTDDEYYCKRKDGATFVVSSSETVIRDENRSEIAIARISRDITAKKNTEREREKLLQELQDALSKVKMLSGLLPICASCKKIRDEEGEWKVLEEYIVNHSEADFSHGLCLDCAEKLYPGIHGKGNCGHKSFKDINKKAG